METSVDFTLKEKTFVVEVGDKISDDASDYVTAPSDDMSKVKLDLSKVDNTTPGTYSASAKLDKKKLKFKVEVTDSAGPVMKAVHENFQFIIEANSTMQEGIDYAGVTAVDAKGNDITADITGWKEALPTEASTVTYNLSVKDADGNKSEHAVIVQYLLPKESTAE